MACICRRDRYYCHMSISSTTTGDVHDMSATTDARTAIKRLEGMARTPRTGRNMAATMTTAATRYEQAIAAIVRIEDAEGTQSEAAALLTDRLTRAADACDRAGFLNRAEQVAAETRAVNAAGEHADCAYCAAGVADDHHAEPEETVCMTADCETAIERAPGNYYCAACVARQSAAYAEEREAFDGFHAYADRIAREGQR